MKKLRLFILASGTGTNAESLIKWAQTQSDYVEIVGLLSDKEEALAQKKAQTFGIKTFLLIKTKNQSRDDYDKKLLEILLPLNIDWIILAGFMRLLGPEILLAYPKRVINIHPSLLPLFPGLDAYRQAYDSVVTESGCTVHYVDKGIDDGEIIAQKSLPKIPGESLEEFKKRGLQLENKFYPETLEKLFKLKTV